MEKYDHTKIEQKWRDEWEKQNLYETDEDPNKEKRYVLDMFPYPSGEGLHVGHPKGYIATDVFSRFHRMNGANVLHPMGWDAFGLPAENYAIKNKIHPRKAVEQNIAHFKSQLEQIGLDYDWSREINTTDPKYYKWTQWIFLQMFKHGLAYQSDEPINWCPSCKTGLANEDLEDGRCERCGSDVERKPLRQWVLKITDYAERLLDELEDLNWPQSIIELQKNWIGRSEGAKIRFPVAHSDHTIEVFTTRPDTLFGATYMVLAPEHDLVEQLKDQIENRDDVETYREAAGKKTEIERAAEDKEKTGVKLDGVSAVNPATNEEIPVFIADYVMAHYGTGAIMAVPAHDARDFAFAQKYNLDVRQVVCNNYPEPKCPILDEAYEGEGYLVNSGNFDGTYFEDAKAAITKHVGGEMTVTYRLQDWVFSRQRYWGEPIPLIHCEKCGVVPVPEDQLPVELPEVEYYEPTGTGESPLAAIEEWVNVSCPECGGAGKRETNTMPQWAGSCWYYLRYMDPRNDEQLVSPEREQYWAPVDMYVGGAEHATRHLIYARFWHKFLYDIGAVSTPEPFARLQHVGLIWAEDGRKMSKRYGNVINPDEIVERFGADTLRTYEMFMGPFDQGIAWNTDNMVGARRFLERVWRLQEKVSADTEDEQDLTAHLHRTIKKVGDDIQSFDFNTAIAALMEFTNAADKQNVVSRDLYRILLQLLAPFAPHMTEELWHRHKLGEESIHRSPWPLYDESKLTREHATITVQVDGKVRATFNAAIGTDEETLKREAQGLEQVQRWTQEAEVERIIVVPDKLVNIVTKR